MPVAHEVAMEKKSIAERVEAAVRQRLGRERMELWFGTGAKWSVTDNNTVLVEVTNDFLADCISKMFRNDLQAAIGQCVGSDWGFEITAIASGAKGVEPSSKGVSPFPQEQLPLTRQIATSVSTTTQSTAKAPAVESACSSGTSEPSDMKSTRGPSLRVVRDINDAALRTQDKSAFTQTSPDSEVDRLVALRRQNSRRWEDFIAGEHNKLAYTGAQMVFERPGEISPFLIYGPNGVGKSHLALGLAERLRQHYRMRRVIVLTGEQFTIEYTESARGGGFANFRRKYRDVEALIIDDVHFCLGKSGTLVELRNTIDMLLRERRQVILVADRGLHELAGLGTDLFARLSGGMSCSIDPVDCVTRKLLLQSLCEKSRVTLADEALDAISKQCGGDARVLQGIVHRLVAQQRLLGRGLGVDDAIRCTHDLVRASQPIVRIADIERAVCEVFGLGEEMLRAKTKCQSISQPRMLAMFLARKYTRTALSEIGEYFGNRQHSTVISAQKKVEQWMDGDDSISVGHHRLPVRELVKSLESALQVG